MRSTCGQVDPGAASLVGIAVFLSLLDDTLLYSCLEFSCFLLDEVSVISLLLSPQVWGIPGSIGVQPSFPQQQFFYDLHITPEGEVHQLRPCCGFRKQQELVHGSQLG